MAEDVKDDIEVNEKSGGNSKILIIIIAVLALALAGVGGMLLMGGDDKAESTEGPTEETAAPVKTSPIYHSIEKPFIVNFSIQSNDAVRYLQVKLKVMARDQAVIDSIKLHMPMIQHELLLLFLGQDYETLNIDGTKQLKGEVLAKINELLKPEELQNELEAVYFSSFLMQ